CRFLSCSLYCFVLPPFPTRRFSDLGVARLAGDLLEREGAVGRARRQQRRIGCHLHLHVALRRAAELVRQGVAQRERALLVGCREDRKSTRLNSSLVKTSYAVYCLKK